MLNWSVASEPFLFFYMFVFGANISLLPQMILSKICHNEFNGTVCGALGKQAFMEEEKYIYRKAAKWDMTIFASAYIPAVFTILPVGAMSDLICRKKMLVIPVTLVFIQNLVYLLCAKFKDSHIGFLVFGASITSLYGEIQGAVMLAYAYVASLSLTHHDRTFRMAILEGSIFVGLGLGSYITGLLVEYMNFVAAYVVILSTSFVNILFVVLILPAAPPVHTDTAKVEDCNESDLARVNICIQCTKSCKSAFLALYRFIEGHILKPDPVILLLLTAASFANSAIMGENTILTLFLKYHPLNFTAEQVGLYYLTLHCIRGFGISCLAVALSKWLHFSDYTLIIIGLISMVTTHVSLSFASSSPMLYGFILFSLAFPFSLSAIRAMLTKVVSQDEQGTVLSCVGVLSLIGATIMTFAANSLFRATAVIFPGFSILLLSFSSLIALAIILYLAFVYSKTSNISDEQSQNELEPLMEDGKDY